MFGVLHPLAEYGMRYASFETAQRFSLAFPDVIVKNGNYRLKNGFILNLGAVDQRETGIIGALVIERGFGNFIRHADDNRPSLAVYRQEQGHPYYLTRFAERRKEQAWHHSGLLHRENGPAQQLYDGHGFLEEERWYRRGTLHREDGPAIISYHNGRMAVEKYYIDGKLQRVRYAPDRPHERELTEEQHRRENPPFFSFSRR